MFGLSELKQTRVYREALQEGERRAKLDAASRFLVFTITFCRMSNNLFKTLSKPLHSHLWATP